MDNVNLYFVILMGKKAYVRLHPTDGNYVYTIEQLKERLAGCNEVYVIVENNFMQNPGAMFMLVDSLDLTNIDKLCLSLDPGIDRADAELTFSSSLEYFTEIESRYFI